MDASRGPSLIARRLNPLIALWVNLIGLTPGGLMVLQVRRRKRGSLQRVPLHVMGHQGAYHLVSWYGESDWVRNLHAAGTATLVSGRTRIPVAVAEEIPVEQRPRVLRAYLMRWPLPGGQAIVGPDGSIDEADMLAIAAQYPIFRLKLA